MMTPKNIKAKTAIEYFKKGYYEKGKWLGPGAEKLGLKGEINDYQVYENIVNGLSPDGRQRLNKREVHIDKRKAAVDCPFEAPKSLSVTALIGGDERLIEAHNQAVEEVLQLMGERYAKTRIVLAGKVQEVIKTGNMVIAKHDHFESRELDPHIHSHCLVMNITQAPNGEWYSHLNDDIFRYQKLLGMMYQHRLAAKVEKIGYETEWKENGQFDIKGYSEKDLMSLSKRRRQILAVAGGANASWAERERAWKKTRRNKEYVPLDELKVRWQSEAKDLELKIVKPRELELEPAHELEAAQASQKNLQKVFDDAIKHCSEKRVAFKVEDIERFVLSHSRHTIDVNDLQPLIDSSAELIHLKEKDGVRYTTQTAVQLELATIRLMQSGQKAVESIAHAEVLEHYLTQTTLNQGQRASVMLALTTTDRVVAWQGVAGAGKTHTLKQVKELVEARGGNVKAFAPNAKTTKVLGRELDAPAHTVDTLLNSKLPAEPEANQYWFVDEAGLLSAKQCYRLLKRAEQEKARIILVGDTKQLSAVEAGAPFKSLQQAGMRTAYMTESQRQKEPNLKLAVDLLAEGRIEAGFERLVANGCVQQVTKETKIDEIVRYYVSLTPAERSKCLLLAGTHDERKRITDALRLALKSSGSLGEDITLTQLKAKDLSEVERQGYISQFKIGNMVMPLRDYKRKGLTKNELYEVVGKTAEHLRLKAADGRVLEVNLDFKKAVFEREEIQIAVGDRLMWKKNNQALEQVNGEEVVVKGIDGSRVEIEEQDGKTRTIDLAQPHHLDHAIVRTTYSSQGETADRVIIAADSTIGKESFYVAASRARLELCFYTQNQRDLLEWALESKMQENPLELIRQQVKQKEIGLALKASHSPERKMATESSQSKHPSPSTETRSTVAPPIKRTDSSQSPTPNVPSRSTVTSPIKSGDKKLRHVVSKQSSQHPPVKRSSEENDMAAIMKATYRHLPKPPDWLMMSKRVYCLQQGWGEVEAILGHRLIVKLDNGTQAQILEWPDAIKAASVVPEPTEAFWIPENPGVAPFHLDPAHWHELTEGSVIHPEIAAMNFKSLQYDMVEQAHEAWEHLFYSDKLERSNTGRLTTGILNRFAHLDDGGWWCSAGIDPRCFKDLQLGKKPDEKLWGCCKPNSPRVDAENPDKVIKYEHPLKTDLSIFLLKIPEQIAERIYKLAGVEPSAEDRASGFWYCVWKHNIPITITEGAKKAASLLSQGHAAIGLPGIYAGYRSKDEYGYDIIPRLHSELAVFATPEREIKFCFDYETRFKTKRNIAIAISRTGTLLEQQGAKVSVVSLLGPEKGVDDLVKAQGPLAYELQATTAVPLQAWSKQGRQQFVPATSLPQLPVLKLKQIQSESVYQVSQTSPIVELSSTVTPSQEQSDERSRQLNTANHNNQGNISTRTDSGESRVDAGDFPRTVTNEYRLEAGVKGLSEAIRGAVELEATERIAGAIARVSASLRDFRPSTRRNSNIRSALERLHQGIREQHHRTNELTAGLTTAFTRLGEEITAESQRQIDSLSTAIRNHAESRAISQQPGLVEALTRLQQQLAVGLEQKQKTRHQLKETLSTVKLPLSTEVNEQLQSAIANLDQQLSQQSVLLKQINGLSNQEFLQLRQQVRAYLEALPPQLPAEAQRQTVCQEISRLSTQIEQLWQQHSSLAKVVEQMQKNPFRLWNKKYDEAFANLAHTTKSIEHAIAQKDGCRQQLQEWAKLEQEYRIWSSNPQTAQMREIASVLKLPQMQERLTQIRQELLQQQAELRHNQLPSQQRRPGRGR